MTLGVSSAFFFAEQTEPKKKKKITGAKPEKAVWGKRHTHIFRGKTGQTNGQHQHVGATLGPNKVRRADHRLRLIDRHHRVPESHAP